MFLFLPDAFGASASPKGFDGLRGVAVRPPARCRPLVLRGLALLLRESDAEATDAPPVERFGERGGTPPIEEARRDEPGEERDCAVSKSDGRRCVSGEAAPLFPLPLPPSTKSASLSSSPADVMVMPTV